MPTKNVTLTLLAIAASVLPAAEAAAQAKIVARSLEDISRRLMNSPWFLLEKAGGMRCWRTTSAIVSA